MNAIRHRTITEPRPSGSGGLRKLVALFLSAAMATAPGQQMMIAPERPQAPIIVRPYLAAEVPPIRMSNSQRLASLERAGIIYLTVQDAIALALENNIDLEISRYNPLLAEWRLERSEAGGALPGVPSGASQAGTVASGQGVLGSQTAAGVGISRATTNSTRSGNATISQIGPVTQTLDPIVQETSTFSHSSNPLPNVVQSLTPVLVSDTRVTSASLQQGLVSGGSVTVAYRQNYLKENSPTDVLNPSEATNISITGQHNLLRGFGVAVNARTITVSRISIGTSELAFKSQVIGVVVQVVNQYYSLAAAYDDVAAKRNAVQVAETFLANVRQQVQIGTLADPDLINAQQQAVTSNQAVVDSQATVDQRELSLKNLLSRNGTADPILARSRIRPVDRITIPDKEDFPPIEEMVRQAAANRVDLALQHENERSAEISALGTRNGVLPSLTVFGSASAAGLAGDPKTVVTGPGTVETPNPYFVGGLGTSIAQVFRRNFPTQRIGAFYAEPIFNRQAQADYAIDLLTLRQTQLSDRRDLNQVQVDVMNNVIALQQARARYQAAAKNRTLQEQLFSAEQQKFSLGASTPYNVSLQQRDLINAQSQEVTALVSYSTARVALDRTLGVTLEANHVNIAEARDARVNTPPVPPPPSSSEAK